MNTAISGTITLDGNPAAGVETSLLSSTGEVIDATTSDEQGHFWFAASAAATGCTVLAKLVEPIVGGAVAQVAAPSQPITIAVSSRQAVELSGEIRLPDGVSFDWVDLHLNPRALDGIAEAAVRALKVVGKGPSQKGSYYTERVTRPEFRAHVLPGTYDLKVEHIVERSPSIMPSPPNLTSATLVLSDGSTATQYFGAHRITLTGDAHVIVSLRIAPE